MRNADFSIGVRAPDGLSQDKGKWRDASSQHQRLSDDPLPRELGGRSEPPPPFWGDFLLVVFKPKVQPGGGAMPGMGAEWE